ncbi:MAG: RluA family pseudouridine synthase [Ruminococcaceae bacterium]|nr:RluA family pseudouridine synthase [Oscillospiraceae bacterium]
MLYNIGQGAAGRSIKDFLIKDLALSRRMISKLKKDQNGILLNGKRVTVRALLSVGDELMLRTEDGEEEINENIVPTQMSLDIIYEDEDIIVVNKSAYVPTHPSYKHFSDSLANGLAYYYKEQGKKFVFRAVNRLDADTSGIVLVAKNKDSAYKLSLEMQQGLIKKDYIAILSGSIESDSGKIRTFIRRKSDSIILREVCCEEDGASYAETEYETLFRDSEISVVKASPITGRTHQLRVHFSYLGYPICDDDLYGCTKDYGVGRHALHAYHISFAHPSSGKRMDFYAPAGNVDDLKHLLGRFGDVLGDIDGKNQKNF